MLLELMSGNPLIAAQEITLTTDKNKGDVFRTIIPLPKITNTYVKNDFMNDETVSDTANDTVSETEDRIFTAISEDSHVTLAKLATLISCPNAAGWQSQELFSKRQRHTACIDYQAASHSIRVFA